MGAREAPRALSLSHALSLSLSRAQVFAARKEDSLSLFALKMVHVHRLRRARDEEHLLRERRTLERAAALRHPFLSMLRYAFRQGPWLVLCLPLLTGGTLQVQLDERANPNGGFAAHEVRWVGAHLTLALGALHEMGLIHRDIKPGERRAAPEGHAAC